MPSEEPRPSAATGLDTTTLATDGSDGRRQDVVLPAPASPADRTEQAPRVTLGRLWDAGIGLLVVYAAIIIIFSQLSPFFLTKNNFLNILVASFKLNVFRYQLVRNI